MKGMSTLKIPSPSMSPYIKLWPRRCRIVLALVCIDHPSNMSAEDLRRKGKAELGTPAATTSSKVAAESTKLRVVRRAFHHVEIQIRVLNVEEPATGLQSVPQSRSVQRVRSQVTRRTCAERNAWHAVKFMLDQKIVPRPRH